MPIRPIPAKDQEMLAIFKALSGSLRFNILLLLRAHPTGLNAGEIADILNGSPSRISHQLSILKKIHLVTATGMDHEMRYTLNNRIVEKLLDSCCAQRKTGK